MEKKKWPVQIYFKCQVQETWFDSRSIRSSKSCQRLIHRFWHKSRSGQTSIRNTRKVINKCHKYLKIFNKSVLLLTAISLVAVVSAVLVEVALFAWLNAFITSFVTKITVCIAGVWGRGSGVAVIWNYGTIVWIFDAT